MKTVAKVLMDCVWDAQVRSLRSGEEEPVVEVESKIYNRFRNVLSDPIGMSYGPDRFQVGGVWFHRAGTWTPNDERLWKQMIPVPTVHLGEPRLRPLIPQTGSRAPVALGVVRFQEAASGKAQGQGPYRSATPPEEPPRPPLPKPWWTPWCFLVGHRWTEWRELRDFELRPTFSQAEQRFCRRCGHRDVCGVLRDEFNGILVRYRAKGDTVQILEEHGVRVCRHHEGIFKSLGATFYKAGLSVAQVLGRLRR